MSPLPPITTIFMISPFLSTWAFQSCPSYFRLRAILTSDTNATPPGHTRSQEKSCPRKI
jgi:hypothetical protein